MQLRPHPSPACIVTWNNQEWLALEPGSAIVLMPNKPVPTGSEYVLGLGELHYIAENKIVLKVSEARWVEFGPNTLAFCSSTGEWYELNVYILGDKAFDQLITHSRPLPREGIIKIGQNEFIKLRKISFVDLLIRSIHNLRSALGGASAPISVPSPPNRPWLGGMQTLWLVNNVELKVKWTRSGELLRLHLMLYNKGKKPVRDLKLLLLKLGKHSPQGIQFPYPIPPLEPGQSQVLAFDFPDGKLEEGLSIMLNR